MRTADILSVEHMNYSLLFSKMKTALQKILFLIFLFGIWKVDGQNYAQNKEFISRYPAKSFVIGYNENAFLKDGEPFRYVSGSMHYFRVPQEYWADRLTKMKNAGLNAVQTYTEWSSHEAIAGKFNFSGNLDVVTFIKTAQEIGLYVILRPGPFIDAERDLGGLPYWLLTNNPGVKLRTMDSDFISYVERWYNKLFTLINPLLYVNGGPIIMVQVENEYGSFYACDRDYTMYLSYLTRKHLGDDILLFTTDGNSEGYLKCGHTDGAYSTVDFGAGANVTESFAALRSKEIAGPLVNSEYYSGWLDHWGQPHSVVSTEAVIKTLDIMLAMNASVNIYMFHGGTSFGFMNGANEDSNGYYVCPTSYDYDAPISEAGDLTPKYYAIQKTLKKYLDFPTINIPAQSPKMSFGPLTLTQFLPIWSFIKQYVAPVQSVNPMTFEELKQGYGFVGYETIINYQTTDPVVLNVTGLKDRGYVYVDESLKGIIDRGSKIFNIPLQVTQNQTLRILVENQGRLSIGNLSDFKGILGDVLLGSQVLQNWTHYPINFVQNEYIGNQGISNYVNQVSYPTSEPGLYQVTFTLPTGTVPSDTFLQLNGWHKGVAFLNGKNLGRYWPIVGPQETLYVPGVWFNAAPQANELVLVELENAPCSSSSGGCTINFVDVHVINGTVPLSNIPIHKLNTTDEFSENHASGIGLHRIKCVLQLCK